MTMKITKTGRGSERNDESLLFEWLNHEVPESIKLSYETSLNTNRFAGSLQTNQIVGIYLEPITFSGEFFGEYISKNNNKSLEYITAKERSDQLARLQGRIIKFWFEGIKQLVIIQKYEIDIKNYNHVEYTITLQPHDIQLPISPIEVKQYLTKSFIQTGEPLVKPDKYEGEVGNISYHTLSPDEKFKRVTEIDLKKSEIIKNKSYRKQEIFDEIKSLKNKKTDIKITTKGIEERKSIERKINSLQQELDNIAKNTSIYDEQLRDLGKKPFKLDASSRELLNKLTP